VALAVAAGTAGGLPAPALAADPDGGAVAADHLARTAGGAAGDYVLLDERPVSAAPGLTGASAMVAAKLLNVTTGEVHVVYRTTDGEIGDHSVLDAHAVAAVAALDPLERKADAPLVAAVAAAPAMALPVAIWLEVDVEAAEAAVRERHPEVTWLGGRPVVSDLEQARALRAELWEARRAAYAAAQDAAAADVVVAGGTVAYASTSAPILFADIPASGIDGLAASDRVQSLGLEGGWEETMTSAGPAVGANWTSGSGDQGNGIRVAVVEYQNVRSTGDLSGQVARSYSTTGNLSYAPSGTADHPMWVAGAIAGLSATYRGVAPGADIVSASTGGYRPSLATDRAIIAAADWAVSPSGGDADIVNTSLGQDTATGAEEARRYFDSIADEDGRTVVGAAGNFSTFGHWDVLSPGTGYNVITVGGLDDRGTAGTGDDVLWYIPGSNGASYRDRSDVSWNPHGDYNKPNLTAPAVNVRTANGMYGSGTSVAAPIVAGISAQLIARDATLASWPEAVRAVLMAGAHRHTRMPDGSINADHEGVGTASATWSNRILVRGGGSWGGYQIGAMQAGDVPVQQFNVVRGQKVRVALAWSSHTSGSNNLDKADALMADLDLRVVGPDGAVVGSYSFDNPYEVVDLVAGASGAVRVEIRHDRFDAPSEPYALAWSVSGPFVDADSSIFRPDILWAWQAGITSGCATDRYCPDQPVTREQMASFLARALHLPATSRDYFTDDERSQHEANINRVAAAGITTGCAATRYCPGATVTREQMASFLARAFALPAATRDYFTDDERSQHEANINRVAAAGITTGCAATRYCPTSSVTRGQMAAFLHRAAAR
jgi:hypothetical protein